MFGNIVAHVIVDECLYLYQLVMCDLVSQKLAAIADFKKTEKVCNCELHV